MPSFPKADRDVTAIEIALELKGPQLGEILTSQFTGFAEPRISLVVCFALTPLLGHIGTAVARFVSDRLAPGLIISPCKPEANSEPPYAICVSPMIGLVRLQSKIVRAIAPGIVDAETIEPAEISRDVDELAAAYIREFLPIGGLPVLVPATSNEHFMPTPIIASGVSMYRLGQHATPQSRIATWSYATLK
jgi:hypothetical protein